MHFNRWYRYGDPLVVKRQRPADVVVASYSAVHNRLRRSRRLGPCAVCGDQATEWAYDHSDQHECSQRVGSQIKIYSLDLSRYFPACHRCHRLYDAMHLVIGLVPAAPSGTASP